MSQLFTNAARSPLQASISPSDTAITIDASLADLFPVANTGTDPVPTVGKDFFKVVLQDNSGAIEIVHVRTRASGAATLSNVIRGREGTTARAFVAGSIVGLRLTAADLEGAIDLAAYNTEAGRTLLAAVDAAAQRAVLAVLSTAQVQADFATKKQLQAQAWTAFTSAGTGAAYTMDTTPDGEALAAGQRYRVKFHLANTSATPTLARDGLAAKALKVYDPAGAKIDPAVGAFALGMLTDIEYDGTDYVVLDPLPAPSVATSLMPVGMVFPVAGNVAPAGSIKANGAAVSRATYPALFAALVTAYGFAAQNFTVTIAAPGVFNRVGHGFTGNERLRLSTTGALPTGLGNTLDYFVRPLTADTFQLSLTEGGTAITTTGSQSGTHSYLQSAFGLGDGTTTFNVPDVRAEFVRGWDDARGVDTGRALGTGQSDLFRAHTHGMGYSDGTNGVNSAQNLMGNSQGGLFTGSTGGSETRPRNIALLHCIKY